MSWERLSELRLRLRTLWRRRALDRDLEDEMQFHLEQRAESYEREGAATEEARRLSRRRFGGVESWKEASRDMWTFRRLETFIRDVRYGARMMRANPGFSLVVVVTLALGIGANAAIFSVFDAAVLRPLPYDDPSRLVLLWGNVERETVERRGTSLADYADWRDQSESFEAMALYAGTGGALQGGSEPVRLQGEFVAQPYFDLLGVQPILGRTFRPEEDEVPQRDAVVVIGAGLWQRQFSGDPSIIGRAVQLRDRSFTVVGVMPEWFRGISDQADFWIPLHMLGPPRAFANRGGRGPAVLAKLKAGVSMAQAQAEMDEICRRLEEAYPQTNEARGVELSPLDVELFGDLRGPLTVLLAAVGLVLLIACTNVANLLLARSEARQREIAVRTALGAGRSRVFGQLTVESGMLTASGTGAGLLLAVWGVGALTAASPIELPSFAGPTVDWRVVAFTAGLMGVTGLLLGLAPAVYLRSVRLHDVFKRSSRGASSGAEGKRFRDILVVAQIAVAVLLLVGAGLFARSLERLTEIRLGYNPTDLLTLRLERLPELQGTESEAEAASVRELLRVVNEVPGVEVAATGSDSPLTSSSAVFYSAEGQAPMSAQERPRSYIHSVSSDFFDALGAPLTAGRKFREEELYRRDSNVVIVSRALADRFWANEDPIGNRIKIGSPGNDAPWLTIVGVVGEMKYRGLPENPTNDPDMFLPFVERGSNFALLVRTTTPGSTVGAVREALRRAEPALVAYNIEPMDRLVREETAQQQFSSWLMTIFAGAALLLATLGIYGVLSYTVARRSQEISVRMALGAERTDVLRLVGVGGLRLVGIGLAIGLGCALASSRLIGGLLYGVAPSDPMSFAFAGVVLTLVAACASLVPAARAAGLAPAASLRED